jgi:hypothetical protein
VVLLVSKKSIDEVVDDLVAVWHDSHGMGGVELHQFLGMTEDEHRLWAVKPSMAGDRLEGYWRWLHALVQVRNRAEMIVGDPDTPVPRDGVRSPRQAALTARFILDPDSPVLVELARAEGLS